ncbi:hypothetical protein ACLB2K_040090 [Fragaria x ananassa]
MISCTITSWYGSWFWQKNAGTVPRPALVYSPPVSFSSRIKEPTIPCSASPTSYSAPSPSPQCSADSSPPLSPAPTLLLSSSPQSLSSPKPPILSSSQTLITPNSLASSPKCPTPAAPIPDLDKSSRSDLLRALESSLGSAFSSSPLSPSPSPSPLIIVISGPSGVGKDAVIKKLRDVNPNLHFVVTATSRPIRPGEVHGKDYYFVSKEEFLNMVNKDELLEYALVYGDYKGFRSSRLGITWGKGTTLC